MNNRSSCFSYGLAALLIGDIHDNFSQVGLEIRRNKMRDKLRLDFTCESYLSTDSLISYTVFRHPTLTVVTIDGIDSVTMGLRLNEGWLSIPDDENLYPANPFFARNALNIWGACSLSGCNMNGPLIVAGHSGGGATAEVLAAYWRQMRVGCYVRCITFGQPRAGGRRHYQRFQRVSSARYMNADDCIPYLPCHEGQGWFGRFAARSSSRRAWDQYQHSANGILIGFGGEPQDCADVDLSGRCNSNDAINFFAGARASLNNGHARLSYVAELTRLAVAVGDLEYFDEDQIPPMRLPPTPVGPVVAQPIAERAQLNEAARNFERQLPASRAKGIFTAEKRNGTWCVVCDDIPVDYFLSKPPAKTFARNMNRAFRGWNSSLFGSANALREAITNNFLGEL